MSNNLQIIAAAGLISLKANKAIVNAAGELLTESTPRTPYKKGELRQKRRVVPMENGARIEWTAQHAAVQNAGQRKGVPFRHYTTSGTGRDFAKIDPQKAVGKVLAGMK